MLNYDNLKASDKTGNAVLAHVTAPRAISSTVLEVDSLDNWSNDFICTVGTLLPSGYIDMATAIEFSGHIDTGKIAIDAFEPGFTDAGNTIGQIAVIKQSTGWANNIVDLALVSHNQDGLIKGNASFATTAGDIGGAWKDWTPTFNKLAGGTLNYAKYIKVGKTVFFYLLYTCAGADVSGSIAFTLPVTGGTDFMATGQFVGFSRCRDSSSGITPVGVIAATNGLCGISFLNSASTYLMLADSSSTVPITWAANDTIRASGFYEAA